MFEKRKARKAQEDLDNWSKRKDELESVLQIALAGCGFGSNDIVLKPGESVVCLIRGVGLVEIRKGQGHWTGGSSGVSVPLGFGVRGRVGRSRGHYVPGNEAPTVIDTGTMYLTTQRLIFTGSKRTVECQFSKVISIDAGGGHLRIAVSNRQKPTVISYGSSIDGWVEPRVDTALAIFGGDTSQVVAEIRQLIAAHNATRPTLPEADVPLPEIGPPIENVAPQGQTEPIPPPLAPPPLAGGVQGLPPGYR